MRKLLLGFGLIFLAGLVLAVDFTPYGNIDMQNYWNLTDLNYIESFKLSGNINASNYNITSVNCIIFDSGGKICSG